MKRNNESGELQVISVTGKKLFIVGEMTDNEAKEADWGHRLRLPHELSPVQSQSLGFILEYKT